MNLARPLRLHTDLVHPEWVDEFNHMNLAFYVLVCDQATYAFWKLLNGGRDLESRNGMEYAVIETHVNYLNEVRLYDELSVRTRLLDFDAKRFHIFHELHHSETGTLSATNEVMALGFNLNTRGVEPFTDSVAEYLDEIYREHKTLSRPANAGRSIGIKR